MPRVLWIIILAYLLPASYPQKKNPQFSVEVNLVSLDVEVLNPQGRAINDLRQNDAIRDKLRNSHASTLQLFTDSIVAKRLADHETSFEIRD
jgi:hypothetical protein